VIVEKKTKTSQKKVEKKFKKRKKNAKNCKKKTQKAPKNANVHSSTQQLPELGRRAREVVRLSQPERRRRTARHAGRQLWRIAASSARR
jgi:hypothetical protein